MAEIPLLQKEAGIVRSLKSFLASQGKVRDTYFVVVNGMRYRVTVVTDRLSIFDFVLPVLVEDKGPILTAIDHFWRTQVLPDMRHHLLPSVKCPGKNFIHDLKEIYPDIPLERSIVTYEESIPPFEYIFRRHLGGSVYSKEYVPKGTVAGIPMKPGIPKWTRLQVAAFTPSTKEENGHDLNLTVKEFEQWSTIAQRMAVKMFGEAYSRIYEFAQNKGIIVLDTKMEGLEVIADELVTPDSSRFTTVEDWEAAMKEGRDPIFFDKEPARVWGKTVQTPFVVGDKGIVGIHRLDPKDRMHTAFVHGLEIPTEVGKAMTERYHTIFEILTGMTLDEYQQSYLF